jgi:hypothetical protein
MTPTTDDRRRAVVEAAEAVAAALDRYVAALEGVAGDLPDPAKILGPARQWAAMSAAQVEHWRHFAAARTHD